MTGLDDDDEHELDLLVRFFGSTRNSAGPTGKRRRSRVIYCGDPWKKKEEGDEKWLFYPWTGAERKKETFALFFAPGRERGRDPNGTRKEEREREQQPKLPK